MDMEIRKLLISIQSFEKSLLISTLEAYFQGQKELFKGLAIENLEKDWLSYPVLHLDLNAEKYDSPERLFAILNNYSCNWEKLYGVEENEYDLRTLIDGIEAETSSSPIFPMGCLGDRLVHR